MADMIDTQLIARQDLADHLVPAPEDLLSDIGPMGQLYYIERLAYVVMGMFAGMLSGQEAKDLNDNDPPQRALAAIALACGNLDAACVALDILPPDAIDGPRATP